jgi:hypothetical protein
MNTFGRPRGYGKDIKMDLKETVGEGKSGSGMGPGEDSSAHCISFGSTKDGKHTD